MSRQGRSKGRLESTDGGEDQEQGDGGSGAGCGATTCLQPGQRLGRGTLHATGVVLGARPGRDSRQAARRWGGSPALLLHSRRRPRRPQHRLGNQHGAPAAEALKLLP